LPHEIGGTTEGSDEIVELARELSVEVKFCIPTALASRVHDRFDHGVKRPLREGRERADLLDLVTEELDSKRLTPGAREDVDQTAADGDLPSLLGALGSFVPSLRQSFDQAVEADLASGGDAHQLGTQVLRRHPFRERPRGCTDETAPSEDLERAGPLADEVGRGSEPRVCAHASAREEGDGVGGRKPADGLGSVACVFVLGENTDERPCERRVERSEDERQRRLRDASAAGEGVDKRAESLALCELIDEAVKWRRVHTSGGNGVPRSHRSPAAIPSRRLS
jgi:hypothetical protein